VSTKTHDTYAVDDAVLKRRFDDLTRNIWSTDAAGNVVPQRNPNARRQLLKFILHVMLEDMERTQTSIRDFDEGALRAQSAAGYHPPRLKSPFSDALTCFTKFGKRAHIAAAFEKGALRVAPASSYDDPSLNPAQTDKELEHNTVTPNARLMFKIYGQDKDGNALELPTDPQELFRYLIVPDFYVWCCGLGYDARLFHEFEAEAAVVITDKNAFRTRLTEAVAKVLPQGELKEGPLRYYDPYMVQREQLMPIFSKHFRYLYQNEYRFAWTIPSNETLEPFFVDLGPLNDIAQFLELS